MYRARAAPDVAGWRRERLPKLPRRGPITAAPDWVCEVLSPRTRRYDLTVKRPFYAQLGVSHAWYVDPPARVLTVSRLESGKWVEVWANWDQFGILQQLGVIRAPVAA